MSAQSQQQDVQSEDGQRSSAGFVTTTIRNIFVDLNPEVLILILCNYTLDQLINFRCSCKRFNAFVLFHQGAIVGGVFEQIAYRTARHVYCGPALPKGLIFDNLIDMTRRCSIARGVALLLTQKRLEYAGSLQRDQSQVVYPTARVAKNAYPYILALLQFFEEYRFRLGSISLDENALLRPNFEVQGLIMAKYNQETVVRLCAIYRILRQLLHERCPRPRRRYLEFFTFAGLERYNDIVGKCDPRSGLFMDFYSGNTRIDLSITTYDGLAPGRLFSRYGTMISLSDDLGHASTGLTGALMPGAADILNLRQLDRDPDGEQTGFLQWLMSYDGEEPRLRRLEG